jgi:amidase
LTNPGQRTQPAAIEPPSLDDVEAMARLDGIELREGEAADLQATISALVEAAARAVDREMLHVQVRDGARDPGRRPTADEDPHNAFIRRCVVEGAREGPLAGRTVGVKDNIAVAGVSMTEGSHFPPFTPTLDAVVVERLLDAGATIVGTLNMDDRAGGATGVMSAVGGRLVHGRRRRGPVRRSRLRARCRPGRQRQDPGRVLRRRRREGNARAHPVVRRRTH